MIFNGPNEEYFEVFNIDANNLNINSISKKNTLSILWFEDDHSSIQIDTQTFEMKKNDIMCLTQLHKIQKANITSCKVLKFNRPFYCILDHDSEVGCKGLLFYGSSQVPILNPKEEDLVRFDTVWDMLIIEMKYADNLQLEMLQMMLKRLLILFTRTYKAQHKYDQHSEEKTNLLRDYNFLVEQHFRKYHTVAEYAQLLHKSPKTISNTFKKLDTLSPLQHIQNRIILEAKRLLFYTQDPISDIADQLGFSEIQSFSRFFKNKLSISPQVFRKNSISGKIDKP